ncbi:hypothetical protein C0V77_10715 [Emticicia sp. TH156]|nr:hypothetical protein C0V77_10715 [Emticicia sp. TH156]
MISSPNLINPAEFAYFAKKLSGLNNIANVGHLIHLKRSLEYIIDGNIIIHEGISIPGDILRTKGTLKEAIQIKSVVSGEKLPFSHVGDGALQFFTTEIPPTGYLKTVELHIVNLDHPLVESTTADLLTKVNYYFGKVISSDKGEAIKNLAEFRIYNKKGTHTFKYHSDTNKIIIK